MEHRMSTANTGRLIRALDGLCRVMEHAVAALLLGLIVVNLLAVFFRYGLNDPLVWTEETLRYVTIWIAMLGSVAAMRRDEHMGVDLLRIIGPAWLARAGRVLVLTLIVSFSALLLWYAVPMAIRNMAQVSPAARIPMVWPYLALVIGAAGMALSALGSLALLALGAAPFAADEDGVAGAE
jgi:TRAP-type C4-dicarboxylate transport system permease small subunit